WMIKAQDAGMKCLTCNFQRFFRSVYGITDNRVANKFHMHPDLMGSSRLQTAFNKSIILKSFQHAEMGYRMLALFCNRHFFPIVRITANGGINYAVVFADYTMDNRLINP